MSKKRKPDVVVRDEPPPKMVEVVATPATNIPTGVLINELGRRYSHAVFIGWLNTPGTPAGTLSGPDEFVVLTAGEKEAAPLLVGFAFRKLQEEMGFAPESGAAEVSPTPEESKCPIVIP